MGRVVLVVALLNLAYFGIEFGVALHIQSVSLFADSVDFLEDTSLNLLIFLALGWSAIYRARLGFLLAGLLLIPGIATLWTAWGKLHHPSAPDPLLLSITALGALAINLSCALLLARVRGHSGSLTRAAFLSARNDALANVAMLIGAALTAYTHRGWADLLIGFGIAVLNADAAHSVWKAAHEDRRAALA